MKFNQFSYIPVSPEIVVRNSVFGLEVSLQMLVPANFEALFASPSSSLTTLT